MSSTQSISLTSSKPLSSSSSTSQSTSTSTSTSSTSSLSSTSTSTSTTTTTTSTQSSSSQTTSTSSSSSSTPAHPSTTSTSTSAPPSTTSTSTSTSLSQQNSDNLNSPPTTVLIITTDSRSSITSFPSTVLTSTSLSTDTNGKIITVTQIFPNPTLSPNDASPNNSAFFRNTAAVAGVFILVGLAVASIILWIFFAIRSRRRTLRLDHDSAVSATLAAAGFHRAPLDDDDDPGESSRRSRYGSPDAFLHHRRSSSGLAMSSVGRASAAFPDPLPFHDDNDPHNFNPYSDYILPAGSRDAYVPSPPPASSVLAGPYRTRSYSNTMGENTTAHAPQHSGGSHEPLLSSYNRVSLPPSPIAVTPPPQRLLDVPNIPLAVSDKPQQTNTSVTSSVYSTESIGDHRLDPNLRQRLQDDANLLRDLRDEDDYSRPVLGVRNLPDASN